MVARHPVQRARRRKRDVSIDDYKEAFSGVLTFVKVDSATGHMAIAFQIRLPAFDYDLAHAGEGPLARLGVLHQLQQRGGKHASSR